MSNKNWENTNFKTLTIPLLLHTRINLREMAYSLCSRVIKSLLHHFDFNIQQANAKCMIINHFCHLITSLLFQCLHLLLPLRELPILLFTHINRARDQLRDRLEKLVWPLGSNTGFPQSIKIEGDELILLSPLEIVGEVVPKIFVAATSQPVLEPDGKFVELDLLDIREWDGGGYPEKVIVEDLDVFFGQDHCLVLV